MVQKPLHPGGGYTETEIEIRRGSDTEPTPGVGRFRLCCANLICEAQTELTGLIHSAPDSPVYRTFPTSRISRSNSFLTTS